MVTIQEKDTININGKTIKLPCSISGYHRNNPSLIETKTLVIVNFYPYMESEVLSFGNVDRERNIWAYDLQGNLIWKVSPPTIRPYKSNPYTSVFEKNGKVYGGNWCGYDFEINLKDGSVTPPDKPGRPW